MKSSGMPNKVVSLVVMYGTFGAVRMKEMLEYCGDYIYTAHRVNDNRWEIMFVKKKAEKAIKKVVSFFREFGVSESDKEGFSRLLLPYKGFLKKTLLRKLGLAQSATGVIFKSCLQKTKASEEPEVPEEDKAFIKWDTEVNRLLAAYAEKKQVKVKKWLEMVTPNLKHPEIYEA